MFCLSGVVRDGASCCGIVTTRIVNACREAQYADAKNDRAYFHSALAPILALPDERDALRADNAATPMIVFRDTSVEMIRSLAASHDPHLAGPGKFWTQSVYHRQS